MEQLFFYPVPAQACHLSHRVDRMKSRVNYLREGMSGLQPEVGLARVRAADRQYLSCKLRTNIPEMFLPALPDNLFRRWKG
jgi:hypothetical protein